MISSGNLEKMSWVVGISLGLGMLFDLFFYERNPGFSVLLFNMGLVGSLLFLSWKNKHSLPKNAYWLMGLVLFFSALLTLRTSSWLVLLDLLVVYGSLVYLTVVASQKQFPFPLLRDYATKMFLVPLLSLREGWRSVVGLTNKENFRDKSSYLPQVVRGTLIALPLVVLLLVLLSSGDAAFGFFMKQIVDINFTPEIVSQWVLIFLVALILTGSFTLILFSSSDLESDKDQESRRLSLIESGIVLGSMNLVFLCFLAVQFRYLFAGETAITHLGFTYAEYARRGFAELLVVSLISYAVIWAIHKAIVLEKENKFPLSFRWLGCGLLAQLIVIIFSAIKRLLLYTEAYGLTGARFYGLVFICWLAVLCGLLAVKVINNYSERVFGLVALCWSLSLIAALNLVNPDKLIARHNMARLDRREADRLYLIRLSEDALGETVSLLDSSKGVDQEMVGGYFYWRLKMLEQERKGGLNRLLSFNLSREKAYQVLHSRQTELERYQHQNWEMYYYD